MAGVAKWLRQWVVVPSLAGSIPVARPILLKLFIEYPKPESEL